MREIVSKRTLYSKTFLKENGEYLITTSSRIPLHFEDYDGVLDDIKLEIEKDAVGNVIAYKLPYQFKLHKTGIGFDYYSRKHGFLKLKLTQLNNIDFDISKEYNYTINESTITFHNVQEDLDIIFKLETNGVRTFRIIKSDEAPKKFTWIAEYEESTKKLINHNIRGWDNDLQKIELLLDCVEQSNNRSIIYETWTGRVKEIDTITHVPRWSNNAKFPITIDPDITESVDQDVSEAEGSILDYNKFEVSSIYRHAGLRFQNIPLTGDEDITSATLTVNVTSVSASNPYVTQGASGIIYGFDTDSSPSWDIFSLPSAATKTSAFTYFPRPGTAGTRQYDVTAIVSEILSRPGWGSGNHLSFILKYIDHDYNTYVTTFEDLSAPGTAHATLNITFQGEAVSISDELDLFIHGHDSFDDNITLFLDSFRRSNDLDLYTLGLDNFNDNCTLYTFSSLSANSGIDLYTHAHITSNDNCTLYTDATFANNENLDLFIDGIDVETGEIDLFIKTPVPIPEDEDNPTFLPLYCEGGTSTTASGLIPFFMYSTTDPTKYSYRPLFLYNDQAFDPRHVLNLYTKGPTNDENSDTLNLYICNNVEVNLFIPLFLKNEYTLSSGYLPLYIEAPSGTMGAVPINNNMNLYMAREFDGLFGAIPLFITTPSGINNNISLFVDGANIENSSIPLYINAKHNPFNTVRLYTHGF